MDALITNDYFIRNLQIGQINQPSVTEALNDLIDIEQEDLLIGLLGVELYEAFASGIDVPAGDPIPVKWQALLTGGTYIDDQGNTRKWRGLANDDAKTSVIANYVYYHYMRNTASFSTGTGEALPTLVNAERTANARKMASAWNEMIQSNYNMVGFLNANAVTYPEWKPVYIGNCYSYDTLCDRRLYWWFCWPLRYGLKRSDLFTPINVLNI